MRPVITVVVALVALLYTGCATEMGNHRHAEHARSQIELTRVQVESRERMALDRAQAQANWALAMAQVAQASPETADAIAVALAVSAVKGSSEETQGPVVQLQRMENSALEWTKALLPTVGNVVTGVGIAAINADVAKTQSDNMTKVQINEDNVDQAQYEVLGNVASSVASFGTAAVQSSGGNTTTTTTYSVADTGILDMSTTTSGDTTSGDTNTDSYNTSGDTNTDSYNTQGDTNADSYNTQGDTTTDSSDNSDNSDNSTGGP
jgi:hypothetical protein